MNKHVQLRYWLVALNECCRSDMKLVGSFQVMIVASSANYGFRAEKSYIPKPPNPWSFLQLLPCFIFYINKGMNTLHKELNPLDRALHIWKKECILSKKGKKRKIMENLLQM